MKTRQRALTKEYFDGQIRKLALHLGHVEKTLNRSVAFAVHHDESLGRIEDDIVSLKDTQDSHTATLDAIFKNTEHWKTEAAALSSAVKRHEVWITQIADKLGMKLETEIRSE